MSGVKGRSGGPRANSGGARPNSGPKPKKQVLATAGGQEPLEFLLAVMNDNEADARLRVRAAGLAAQYVHVKRADGGKKDDKRKAAEVAGTGKFAPADAPKLVVNNRR